MTTDFRALCVELTDCLEKADWPHRYKVVFQQWTDIARAALAQPEPEGPTPHPVSERLPGPGDCDAKGRCWIGRPEYTFPMGDTGSWGHADPEWCLEEPHEAANSTAVWLPAHALPVPGDD